MKKLLLIISIAVNSCSFIVPKYIKKEFKSVYNNKPIDIANKLQLDGYYTANKVWNRDERSAIDGSWKTKIDTTKINLLIFRDGIAVYHFHNYEEEINLYFKQIKEDTNNGKSSHFYKEFYWGYYIISNDTIKAKFIDKPNSLNESWWAFETWFKIVDNRSISEIKTVNLIDNKTIKFTETKDNNELILQYKHSTIIPNSNSWLKKKKWFWINSKDYKSYMKNNEK